MQVNTKWVAAAGNTNSEIFSEHKYRPDFYWYQLGTENKVHGLVKVKVITLQTLCGPEGG